MAEEYGEEEIVGEDQPELVVEDLEEAQDQEPGEQEEEKAEILSVKDSLAAKSVHHSEKKVTFQSEKKLSDKRSQMSNDDVFIDINDPAFDSPSEYYDSEEEREMAAKEAKNQESIDYTDPEEAYKRWLLHWGTTDF